MDNASLRDAAVAADKAREYFVTDAMLVTVLLAAIWAAVAITLALRVRRAAERREQPVGPWFVLTLLFGPAGYAGWRVWDDCRSRQTAGGLASVLALVTVLWLLAGPPILLASRSDIAELVRKMELGLLALILGPIVIFAGPAILFATIYLLARPRLTIDMVRQRLHDAGRIVEMDGSLLLVEDLVKHFPVRKGVFGRVVNHVKAVDGVSFELKPGRTLGLVGESGCGKTTAGRAILNLLTPTSGRVVFDGIDLSLLSPGEMRAMRRQMQLIFQDPFGSLNPRMTVLGIVGEALGIHGEARGAERVRRVEELLAKVGLDRRHVRRYPHEFSGGQRQRIGIARALALNPRFIVCDEPVSALDVSIQAQIINLLSDLQKEFGLTYLFIAHDLSVVQHVSDDVAVMYLGRLVEKAPSELIYREPLHPYTMALLSAIPRPDPGAKKQEIVLEGDVPSPLNPPPGCRFHTRCRYMVPACREHIPELREIAPGHFAACIRAEEIRQGAPPADVS